MGLSETPDAFLSFSSWGAGGPVPATPVLSVISNTGTQHCTYGSSCTSEW